jgi:hypothetical protein
MALHKVMTQAPLKCAMLDACENLKMRNVQKFNSIACVATSSHGASASCVCRHLPSKAFSRIVQGSPEYFDILKEAKHNEFVAFSLYLLWAALPDSTLDNSAL